MPDLKPIKLYSHGSGPNPWKVVIVLKELGLRYDTEFVEMSNMKSEPFVSVNVNGRVPAIEDPNNGVCSTSLLGYAFYAALQCPNYRRQVAWLQC